MTGWSGEGPDNGAEGKCGQRERDGKGQVCVCVHLVESHCFS